MHIFEWWPLQSNSVFGSHCFDGLPAERTRTVACIQGDQIGRIFQQLGYFCRPIVIFWNEEIALFSCLSIIFLPFLFSSLQTTFSFPLTVSSPSVYLSVSLYLFVSATLQISLSLPCLGKLLYLSSLFFFPLLYLFHYLFFSSVLCHLSSMSLFLLTDLFPSALSVSLLFFSLSPSLFLHLFTLPCPLIVSKIASLVKTLNLLNNLVEQEQVSLNLMVKQSKTSLSFNLPFVSFRWRFHS